MAAENEAVEEAVDVEMVGQILRAYRVAAGLTQAALAERALVGEQTIGYLERDLVRRPQHETLGRLIVALDLSADEQRRLGRARRRQPPRLVQRAGQSGDRAALVTVDERAILIVDLFVPPAGAALALPPAHLVTLTGPSQETTAAALAAHALFHARGYGNVYFVSLAGLDTPARLPGAILAAITAGVETPSTTSALLEYLRTQHLLLILDRCEHLIDPCAALIDDILQHCPAVCAGDVYRAVARRGGDRPPPRPARIA